MVHTLPDYTTKYKMTTIFGNIDDAELAARLGSINTFDRRGKIFWYDDFEGTSLQWLIDALGTGASIDITMERWRSRTQSVKLITGDAGTDYVSLSKYFFLPRESRVGVEFSIITNSNVKDIQLFLTTWDGTYQYSPKCVIDVENDKVKYLNSSGSEEELGPAGIVDESLSLWSTVKMVIDYTKKEYVRVQYNKDIYSLEGEPIGKALSDLDKILFVDIQIRNKDANNRTSYIDDFILTQGEP